jgi:hypothetical protein
MANNYTNDILYYELGLSHSVEVSKYISANFGLITAFYNRNQIKGFSYYDASFGLGMKLSDKLSMTPNIHFMSPQGDFKDAKKGNHDDELYGGVNLSYSI